MFCVTHWTKGAAECFRRKLRCDFTCSNYEWCSKQEYPPMKKAVLYLYAKFNKPSFRYLEDDEFQF